MKKLNLKKILVGLTVVSIVFTGLITSCKNTGSKPLMSDNQEKRDTVYSTGKTYQVEHLDRNGQNTFVQTGTIEVNGQEEENWVSAKDESVAASYLLLMYSSDQDYMRLCSKNLKKDKVEKALSDWHSLGGEYRITVDRTGKNIVFYGGVSGSIFDLIGRGNITVNTIQEKTMNYITGDDNGKYVITYIDFEK